ncbi:MAG: hypothetical protein ABXS91_02815 [Sulfurimonas sp.]
MKKYFIYLLLILSTTYLYAISIPGDMPINECKSDVYFANGIKTTAEDADNNQKLIWKKVLAEQYGSKLSRPLKNTGLENFICSTFHMWNLHFLIKNIIYSSFNSVRNASP